MASRWPRCASRFLMNATSCGRSSAAVLISAIAARARRRSARIVSRCCAAASWNRARRRVLPVSARICCPLSGSTKVTTPTSGISLSRGSVIQTAITSWRIASELSGCCQPPGVIKSLIRTIIEGRRMSRPASVSARPRSVSPPPRPPPEAVASCWWAARSMRAINCKKAVRPAEGGMIERTRSSKSSAPTRLPRPISNCPTTAVKSMASWRLRQRAVLQSSDRVMSTSNQASSPRSGNDSRTYGRSDRAVIFHSMVRGSSPGWYSRTSLYSSPAPRKLDRSSPPGWNPRRRSTGQRERRNNWSMAIPPLTTSGGNPISKVDSGWREPVQHALDDRLGGDPRRDPFIGEDQPVPDHLRGHFANVMGKDVRPPAHEGQRTAGGNQADRCAWAGPVGECRGQVFESLYLAGPAGVGQRGGIGPYGRVDVDLAHGFLHLLELIQRHHLVELDLGSGDAFDDDDLLLEGRVVDQDLQHESVELRLRQRVGAVGLDRALSCEHDKGIRKMMSVLPDP